MIIKLKKDAKSTKVEGYLVLKNTSKEEILNFLEQENFSIIDLIIEALYKKGISIFLEN